MESGPNMNKTNQNNCDCTRCSHWKKALPGLIKSMEKRGKPEQDIQRLLQTIYKKDFICEKTKITKIKIKKSCRWG